MSKKAKFPSTLASTTIQSDEADEMVVKRTVSASKGKWARFPPEVINRKKMKKVNGKTYEINLTRLIMRYKS